MERRYRSLLLSDEPQKLKKAREEGLFAVPCLPLKPEKPNPEDPPEDMDLSGFPFVLEHADEVEEHYLDRIDAALCGYPLQILQTERCLVREICTDDLPALYEIYKDPEITRYMEDLYEDPDRERAYIEDYIKWHYGLYDFGMWIIADHNGRVLGRAGFEQKEDPDHPELGFMIRRDQQKKGLAFEVCSALLSQARSDRDWKGVKSFCHKENAASVALLQKLGFRCVAEEGEQLSWLLDFSDVQ